MIFFIASFFFILIFLYPFVIYPNILGVLPKVPLFRPGDAAARSVTLLFCAYNEEKSLPAKIANLRRMKALAPDLEILAYSDMSTDATLQLLEAASDILTPVAGVRRLGKASGMALLAARAKGDILIFTDANVIIEDDAVAKLKKYFSDPEIGTVSGRLEYVNETDSTASDVGGRYWSLEERIKALESETGSTMGADGSIFATRRSLYPDVPPHLLDDLIASISPLFQGYRVISAPDVVAYERLTTDSRDEYRRRRRIACRALNTHRHLRPGLRRMSPLNKFKYLSHRFLRWFCLAFLVAAAGFFLAGAMDVFGVLPGLALCVLPALAFGLLWMSGQKVAGRIGEILMTLVATSQGLLESMSGKTYQTWTPAESRSG